MRDLTRLRAAAAILLRLALAASFLSAVADRFGLWGPPGSPGVAWGDFAPFLADTKTLLWFLPASLVPAAGWAATTLEFLLAIGLVAGVRLPVVALASGFLLSGFAISMTIANGAEGPFSYSVWTAAAGAFLLATLPPARFSTEDDPSRNAHDADQIAPHEPPPPVSSSRASVHRTLDPLPAPASRGGR